LAKEVPWATPERQKRWKYTRSYCDFIIRASEKYNLNPHLLAALIWWESGGNPLAYSISGAVGLMQVMPRDGLAADDMCKYGLCFADRPTTEELEVPEFNIDFGSGYLVERIALGGSLRNGLMGYGPEDVGYSYADKILGLYELVKKQAFDEAGT
jgi:soluble lytic murein transglycosylase-like protein